MDLTTTTPDSDKYEELGDPGLRALLVQFLRRRVPAADVEDVAQATLMDALAAQATPADKGELRRFLYGIAHHKVADLYRRRSREAPLGQDAEEVAAESGSFVAQELADWALRELPDGEQTRGTLDWMLREGDGEALDTIAREERLPAPTVRQRVARLRRHFRTRWAAELAALSLLSLFVVIGLRLRHRKDAQRIVPIIAEPVARDELLRARVLRDKALEDCAMKRYAECVSGLDDAKDLDPAGDGAVKVRDARRAASSAPAETAVPSVTAVPPLAPSAAPPAPVAPSSTSMAAPAPKATKPSNATGLNKRVSRHAQGSGSSDVFGASDVGSLPSQK